VAGYVGIPEIGSQGYGSTCSPGQFGYGAILVVSYLISPQVPPGVFFEGVELSEHQAKHYLTADPALADWYRQLRTESSQSRHYTLEVPALAEWDLVMHSARLYNRMGCQILALDLGKQILSPTYSLPILFCTRLKTSST